MDSIRLAGYEGPLPLLVFFAQRQEIDAFQVWFSELWQQLESYMAQASWEEVAQLLPLLAFLLRWKATQLLPAPQDDSTPDPIFQKPEGWAGEKVLPLWENLWAQQLMRFGRPSSGPTMPVWTGITPSALALTWKALWLQNQTKPQHLLTQPSFPMETVIATLEKLFAQRHTWSFPELLSAFDAPAAWVGTFLCLLDWIMRGRLYIQENVGPNQFTLSIVSTS
ncbi:MAG: hypothetical protein ACUVRD_09060 [Bacteroidia bacterium]